MLSPTEKNLIIKLAAKKITPNEFFSQYPTKIYAQSNYILKEMQAALLIKDKDAIECLIYLRPFHAQYESTETHAGILRLLLQEDWHKSHELIIDALTLLPYDQLIVDSIFDAAKKNHSYLSMEDNHALAKKCVYALSEFGTDYSLVKLRMLSETADNYVKNIAKKELSLHQE